MKKLFVVLSFLVCVCFTAKAQISDVHGYYAQTLNLQSNSFTSAQVGSFMAHAGDQYASSTYKDGAQWKVGTGLLIAGGACIGVVGATYIALVCANNLDDMFADALLLAWSSVFVGSAGAVMMVVGGILMGTAKNNYTAATFNLGDGRTYAQLGLTPSGNMGLSLTF